MTRPLIVYHSPCADGFTAAWAAHRYYDGDADFFAAEHHKPLPDVTGRDVTFLDIAPKRVVLEPMTRIANSITILDHHKGAMEEIEGVRVTHKYFDLSKSGAGIAWDYYFTDAPRPWLVNYVEDRDIWTWKLPNSREVCAALDVYEQTFERWEALSQRKPEDLVEDGKVFKIYQDAMTSRLLTAARETVFEGYNVLTVNSAVLQSDLGAALAKGRPFSVVWRQLADGYYAYSLRSDSNGLDVSVIARKYGGNGHPNASGFSSKTFLL